MDEDAGAGGVVEILDRLRHAVPVLVLQRGHPLAVGRLAEPDAVSLGEDGYALARKVGDPELLLDVTFAFALALIETTQLDRASKLLEEVYDFWSERDEYVTGEILWRLACVELARGRLPLAADYAHRAREIAVLYGPSIDDAASIWTVALIEAHRGALDRARELGLAESWGGDPGRAVEHFSAAEDARSELGSLEPNVGFWRADYVEALLELGRIDEALAVLDPWEADATRLERGAVLAKAARCRGLVAAALGQVTQAAVPFEEAVGRHDAVGDPIGRARSLLQLGAVRRRARQRRAAREAIEEAIAIFEECGALGWAERARAELGSIGGRSRESGLTAAEKRVATLVAEGKTNREVAAALFLGERTVETHLTHIYAKLGIRSRTELARTLASGPGGS